MRRLPDSILICALAAVLIAMPARAAAQPGCASDACGPITPPASAPADFPIDTRSIARIENTLAGGRSLGSGTLVDTGATQGLVVTCAHLFRGGVGRIVVYFPQQAAYEARLVKIDAAADLAALAIQSPPLAPAELATNYPQRGDLVLSCGFGGDGRLAFNRGQVLGYVTTLGSHGRETLELSGSARQGDSGGPVFDRQGQLVGVLFGTNGREVDATFCGRVREFLEGLSERFAGRAGDGQPAPPAVAPPGESTPHRPLRPVQPKPASPASPSGPVDGAIDALEGAARPWLSAKATALLVAIGVPGGLAGLAGAGLVWLAMRRGRRRLQTQLEQLQARIGARTEIVQPQPVDQQPSDKIVERHHNRYVSYEATSLDKAWSSAHARVGEKYPGAVPYLKIVEGVKEQLLSGIEDPQIH